MTATTASSPPRLRRLHAPVAAVAAAAMLLGVLVMVGQSPAGANGPTAIHVTPGHGRVDRFGRVWQNDRAFARGGRVVKTHALNGRVPKRFRFVRSGRFSYSFHLAPAVYRIRVDTVDARPGLTLASPVSVSSRSTMSTQRQQLIAHLGREEVFRSVWTTRLSSHTLRLHFGAGSRVTGLSVIFRRPPPRHAHPVHPTPPPVTTGTPTAAPSSPTSPTAPTSPAAPTSSAPTAPTAPTPTSSAPATTTSPITLPTPTSGAPANSVTPEDFGAAGNGITDDTAALQRAFDDADGRTVYLPAGHVYAHDDVLHLRVAGLHVTGPGELLATNEEMSSVWIEADNVTIDGGVVLRTASTTQRWTAWEQMGLRLFGHSGAVVRDVTVDGSAAAGIYVGGGAHDFVLDHDVVENTRADGIHMTDGAYNGQVISPTIRMSGDDGVAVVSYQSDGTICHDISVTSPTVLGTTGGRGLSVVGGQNITETNIDVEATSAAGVYIAAEGNPWYTAAPTNVSVTGGSITDANTNTTVDHGAVLVYSGQTGVVPSNVTVSNLTITGTRSTASRDIGVVEANTPPNSILLSNLTISGGPRTAYEGNTPQWTYQTRHIVQNGTLLPDQG